MDKDILNILALLIKVQEEITTLRTNAAENGFNVRSLSVALTELETSMLWLANARPDDTV